MEKRKEENMKGKHILAGWFCGALLSSGIWLSVIIRHIAFIVPTVLLCFFALVVFALWILSDKD